MVLVQTRNETKRITELLTELPADVDAEGLLIRNVVRAAPQLQSQTAFNNPAGPAGPGADIKALGSRRHESRSRHTSREFDVDQLTRRNTLG
jgi:hypothetical protein